MSPQDYDSWAAYWETTNRHHQPGKTTVDHGSYLPSPDEITIRRNMLHSLKSWGFNQAFVASVMQADTPNFKAVADSVARYGVEGTWERYRDFI